MSRTITMMTPWRQLGPGPGWAAYCPTLCECVWQLRGFEGRFVARLGTSAEAKREEIRMTKPTARKSVVVAPKQKKEERANRLAGATASPFGKPITVWVGPTSFQVRRYSAAVARPAMFNDVHAACGTRLTRQMVCPHDGKVVAKAGVVKGYEQEKGSYLRFTDEELRRFDVGEEDRLDIEEFVPTDTVDVVYIEKSTYLGPTGGSDKAYALLAQLLTKLKRSGVGRLGTKRELVLVSPYKGDGLLIQHLFYASEVRSFDDVDRGSQITMQPAAVSATAEQIAQLSSERFDPSKYRDEYRERVLYGVAEKAAGRDLAPIPPRVEPRKIVDLGEFRTSVDEGVARISAIFDRAVESVHHEDDLIPCDGSGERSHG